MSGLRPLAPPAWRGQPAMRNHVSPLNELESHAVASEEQMEERSESSRYQELGFHVLCAGSRYQRNDTALIMENVLLDLGAYIRAAKEDWGYERVVLCGWSGGGSLTMLYQSQAERPSITQTPAGDPVDVAGAGLIPADAVLSLAAHASLWPALVPNPVIETNLTSNLF